MHDQMHMIGHEHEGPEVKLKFLAGRFDRIGQPFARPLSGQKAVLAKAGKCQFVRMPRVIAGSRALETAAEVHGRISLGNDCAVAAISQQCCQWQRDDCPRVLYSNLDALAFVLP